MTKDKYKHAMEILSAASDGKLLQWSDDGKVWCDNPHLGSVEVDQLNDPDTIRLKPTPSKVPLGPEDITSDMWFAVNATHHKWLKASSLYSDGIALPIHAFVNYQQLREQFVYRRDGWEMNRTEKCEKPSTPPPKREPRRVWVCYNHGKLPASVHDSVHMAKDQGSAIWCSESAVEFVEVVKS